MMVPYNKHKGNIIDYVLILDSYTKEEVSFLMNKFNLYLSLVYLKQNKTRGNLIPNTNE